MSYTAKTKAARFLRKYTASADTPVYAAAIDAQTCVLALCDVPWEESRNPGGAFTSHNADSLDENVANRDAFDAALFCAGHAGGKHRAYANAACYRITVPEAGIGATLENISFSAASDPYNAAGLRIHVFTSDDPDVPMNCRTLRGEDASGDIIDQSATAAGAVPRTAQTAADGSVSWFAASGTVSLSPDLTLEKYIFIVVALENYNTSRGNWLEGSGFARNDFSLTTDIEIDWTESDFSYTVLDPALPLPLLAPDSCTGRRSVAVLPSACALQSLYRDFLAGEGDIETASGGTRSGASAAAAPGAMFNVRKAADGSWQIFSSVLCVPVAMPGAFVPSAVSVVCDPIAGAPAAAVYRLWIAIDAPAQPSADILKNPALYDARGTVEGLRLAGSFRPPASNAATFSFDLSEAEAAARSLTLYVSAWLPPDAVNLSSSAAQGTGGEIFPAVSLS